MRRTFCALALIGLVSSSSSALAQGAGTSPGVAAPQVRHGMLIGFGVGGGNISAECDQNAHDICDEVLESGSFSGHIGSMVAPRLGVMLDVWPMIYHEDFLTITHVITTAAAQYWITPALWVKGGIGVARAEFNYDGIFVDEEVQTDTVAGVMAGVGYEIYRKPDFAIDLQLRAGTGFYKEDEVKGHSGAFEVGFNWY